MIGKYGLICLLVSLTNWSSAQFVTTKASVKLNLGKSQMTTDEIRKLITLSLAVVMVLDKNEKKQQQQTPSRA